MIWHLTRLVDKWFMLLKQVIWQWSMFLWWNMKDLECKIYCNINNKNPVLSVVRKLQQVLYKHSTDAHPDLPQTALNYFPTSSRHAYSKPISRSLPQIHNNVVVLYIKWVLNEETCWKSRTEKKGLTTNSKHLFVFSRSLLLTETDQSSLLAHWAHLHVQQKANH